MIIWMRYVYANLLGLNRFNGDRRKLKIMLRLILVVNLICPEPLVLNKTGTWVELDAKTFSRAKIRCGELFRDAPCLKVFEKVQDRLYRATCSKPGDTDEAE